MLISNPLKKVISTKLHRNQILRFLIPILKLFVTKIFGVVLALVTNLYAKRGQKLAKNLKPFFLNVSWNSILHPSMGPYF
jgi:hypothetical protein